jgi:hypothetical protein
VGEPAAGSKDLGVLKYRTFASAFVAYLVVPSNPVFSTL